MADAGRSNRRPVSLNDRHYRLLQDLSSAPKPKPSTLGEEERGDVDGAIRPRFSKAEDNESGDFSGPGFSAFGDFDLPPRGEGMEGTGRRLFDKPRTNGSGEIGAPSFSGFIDFDSPRGQPVPFPGVGEEEKKENSFPNSDSPSEGQGEEEKHRGQFGEPNVSFEDDHTRDLLVDSALDRQGEPTKAKLEGRRRLCKASSRDHGSAENGGLVQDECEYAEIADFNSPVPHKLKGHYENKPGGCEIRDILNDLSSKLDRLTIEKKKFPEANVKLPLNIEYDDAETSKEDGEDDANLHDYDAEIAREERKDDVNLRRGYRVYNDEDKGDGSVIMEASRHQFSRVQDNNKIKHTQNKGKSKIVPEKVRYAGRSFPSNLRDEEEEDDDCQVVKESKHSRPQGSDSFDYSNVVDLSNDSESKSAALEEDCLTLSGSVSAFKLPGKIAKILYPHQREGLRWLWSLHSQGKGGILGDDMGLGKTMQICGFLAGLFHSRLIKRALVVAPKTLLDHWIKELSIVGLSGKTREYFGTSAKVREYELQYILQDKGVLLTTYDIVRNNSKSLKGSDNFAGDEEDGFTWDYMILDEGHLIKNPSTQRAKSLLEIPSAHRIVISGTPIQNNLKELWALFSFCCPGLLGDHKWFKEKYENRILKGNDKKASDRDKRIGSAVAKELREKIQPYFLRRMKNEVFKEDDEDSKLSKKNEIIVWLRLTGCQRQLYEAFLQSELVLSAFDGSPLAALTILKKICDHPLLLTKRAAEDVLEGMDSMLNQEDACLAEKLAMHIADYADRDAFEAKHDSVSCKISFIMSLLDNLIPQGHRILIFSQTRKMLNLIEESLLSNGYKFLRIDGTTKSSDRVKVVNDFQEGFGAPIFLLTSQVGGLGLTLTRADRVIVVDPAWNPSTDNQSVDRAYRIGQLKDVIVYRLMTCGTVEEKIYRKQIFKGGLFKSATEHKEQIRYFSQQDLRELFSLPKLGFNISVTQQQLHEEHDSQYTMDESLERHIKFLETKGIAGVSHHSLLFSKSAPVQAVTEDEAEEIRRGTSFAGNAFSRTSVDPAFDGAGFAFNPKDVKPRKFLSPDKEDRQTESQIKERINRISQLLENKATVSRLPDGGAKLQKQIAELNAELKKIRMEKQNEKEVTDVDDITGKFSRALNV